MLNERVKGVEEMMQALNRADRFLDSIDDKVKLASLSYHPFPVNATCRLTSGVQAWASCKCHSFDGEKIPASHLSSAFAR